MTAPYGSWMGSTIEDSFYAPHDLLVEIQGFLADHDDLYQRRTQHELAVVFSVESTRELISRQDASDNLRNARDESVRVPYRVVAATLAGASEPFDVVLFPDGVTAPDRVSPDSLHRYATVVLPDCAFLTGAQVAAVEAYLAAGGRVVVTDRLGVDLPADVRQRLLAHSGVHHAAMDDLPALTPLGRQVSIDGDLGVNVAALADGSAAVHLVNYGYDADADGVRVLRDVDLTIRLPFDPVAATLVQPGREPVTLPVRGSAEASVVTLPALGVYSVVVLRAG
jgi:hypothetical protein